jgi:DNA-binding IscR family transcriptional regulator
MQYTVIFGTSNKGGLGLAEAPNALEALAIIEVLQSGDEEIRCIRSRQEGEIGVEMLRVLAKEEEEELPVAMG